MNRTPPPAPNLTTNSSTDRRLGPIHGLLTIQTVMVFLVSVNRLSDLATGYVASNEFLRWVEINNMLILPLISLTAFYLLKKHLEYDNPHRNGRWHLLFNLTFFLGVYLLGVNYGNHEVTNYLHIRFCPEGDTSALCRIIIFNDDEFSHWVFFAGFILINSSLMLLQVIFPRRNVLVWKDVGLLALNGCLIALGIFANLAFEEIGFDLYVIALLAILALTLLLRPHAQGTRQPLLIYYSVTNGLGLVATFIYKSFILFQP